MWEENKNAVILYFRHLYEKEGWCECPLEFDEEFDEEEGEDEEEK